MFDSICLKDTKSGSSPIADGSEFHVMIVCGKKLFLYYDVRVEIYLSLWEWAALVRLGAGSKYCSAGTSTKLLMILNIMMSLAFVLLDFSDSISRWSNMSVTLLVYTKQLSPASSPTYGFDLSDMNSRLWSNTLNLVEQVRYMPHV